MRWPLWRGKVADRSMEPILRPGDWLLVWRPARRGRPPRVRPGQLVVAFRPDRPGLLIVKRAARREPGGWWLESANTDPAAGAADSRVFGPVPASLIEGRILLRYRRGPAASGPGAPAERD
ncbi:MAG: S24 family peptidase [Gemmatimonadota bacterium]